jgi:F420 biosynthesis protein FbiB-like protein
LTHTTELHNFLRTRRSIRRFKPDPVPDSVIREILHTATFAPSAHNRQPWRFAVLKDAGAKTNLSHAMEAEFIKDLEQDGIAQEEIEKRVKRSRERMTSAPVAVILCVDMSEMDIYSDTKRKKAEYIIASQSTANAGLQLLLAAHAEGLGGVWVCSPMFAQETVRQTLELPGAWEPQAMLLLGYPSEAPKVRERKFLEGISIFR